MSTFTWKHDRNPGGDVSFRNIETKFGDGYSQIAPDGINTRVESWPLTFTGVADTITQVTNFLDARRGAEPFGWTSPSGQAGRFLASKYSITSLGNDVFRLSVTFTQDFSP